MSLTQKASQVLLAGFPGREAGATISDLIEKGPPGGVILFERNLGHPQEVQVLTRALQTAAAKSAAALPLLVAVDQEGGPVARLEEGVPALQAARQVASTMDAGEAESSAYRMGLSLRRLGVNMNLAPVLDLVDDPSSFSYARSYGSSAEVVSLYGRAVMRGYAQAGVITAAKHFPGHGSADGDTHDRSVHSRLSLDALREHLAPFEAATAEGVPVIMVAHLFVDTLDSQKPASLSPAILQDLLREQVRFRGVASSDDLEMLSDSLGLGVGQAAVEALRAGIDLLIVSGHRYPASEARDAIVQAVQTGALDPKRLDEAVCRILRLKAEFGLL
jgi:beta-N-acetylhexosaminidase